MLAKEHQENANHIMGFCMGAAQDAGEAENQRSTLQADLPLGAVHLDFAKNCCCSDHSTGNGSSTCVSVTSGPCFPSRIASTMSVATTVRHRTRVKVSV